MTVYDSRRNTGSDESKAQFKFYSVKHAHQRSVWPRFDKKEPRLFAVPCKLYSFETKQIALDHFCI